MMKKIKVCLVKTPNYKKVGEEVLEDLSIFLNAKVLDKQVFDSMPELNKEVVGTCENVKISKSNFRILVGKKNESKVKDEINNRVNVIEDSIKNSVDNYDKEILQERLARFKGGFAVIMLGGESEIEMKEKKDRLDDAIFSTKSALDGGYVVGGGVVFLELSKRVLEIESPNEDFKKGLEILSAALTKPLQKIIKNAAKNPETIIEEINKKAFGYGYNIKTEQYGFLEEDGVIEPANVLKRILKNASSTASTLLTTEAVVLTLDEVEEN